MPIALVQQAAVGSGSLLTGFGSGTTAGNLLICLMTYSGTATLTLTGTGWARVPASTNNDLIQIFYRPNCGASESPPTVGGTGGTVPASQLLEFSGADTVTAIDRSAVSTKAATSPRTATNAGTDVTTGELIIGGLCWILSKAATHASTVPFNNATSNDTGNNDATSIANHYRFAYGISTANASADSSVTTSDSMNLSNGQAGIASFLVKTRVPRSPGIDSGNAHFAKAVQTARRWRRGAHGIFIPDRTLVLV